MEDTPLASPACTPPPSPREPEEEPVNSDEEDDGDSYCTDTETEPGNRGNLVYEVVSLIVIPAPGGYLTSTAFDNPCLPPVTAGAYPFFPTFPTHPF